MGTVKIPACLFLWVVASVSKPPCPCDILGSHRAAHEVYRPLRYGVLSVGTYIHVHRPPFLTRQKSSFRLFTSPRRRHQKGAADK
jgi:hypothetical protein